MEAVTPQTSSSDFIVKCDWVVKYRLINGVPIEKHSKTGQPLMIYPDRGNLLSRRIRTAKGFILDFLQKSPNQFDNASVYAKAKGDHSIDYGEVLRYNPHSQQFTVFV